jgi:hypothetical protein
MLTPCVSARYIRFRSTGPEFVLRGSFNGIKAALSIDWFSATKRGEGILALTRCTDCNSTIKADELECYACGTPVEGRRKSRLSSGFSAFVTFLFFASFLLTIASLFLENLPTLPQCLMVNVVLLIIRCSSGEMIGKKSS